MRLTLASGSALLAGLLMPCTVGRGAPPPKPGCRVVTIEAVGPLPGRPFPDVADLTKAIGDFTKQLVAKARKLNAAAAIGRQLPGQVGPLGELQNALPPAGRKCILHRCRGPLHQHNSLLLYGQQHAFTLNHAPDTAPPH